MMENCIKIEQKLGFEKIREQLLLRCSTNYARERVAGEKVSHNPATITKRLVLTDEMRLICMFESSFPQSGFATVSVTPQPGRREKTFSHSCCGMTSHLTKCTRFFI